MYGDFFFISLLITSTLPQLMQIICTNDRYIQPNSTLPSVTKLSPIRQALVNPFVRCPTDLNTKICFSFLLSNLSAVNYSVCRWHLIFSFVRKRVCGFFFLLFSFGRNKHHVARVCARRETSLLCIFDLPHSAQLTAVFFSLISPNNKNIVKIIRKERKKKKQKQERTSLALTIYVSSIRAIFGLFSFHSHAHTMLQ